MNITPKSNYTNCRKQIRAAIGDLQNDVRHRGNPLFSKSTERLRDAFIETAEALGFAFTAHDSSLRAASATGARTLILRYNQDTPCLRLEIRKGTATGTKEFNGEVAAIVELSRLKTKALKRQGSSDELHSSKA